MPVIVAVLPGNGMPAVDEWNAWLAEWQIEAQIQRVLPWTSEAGRFKIVVSVGGHMAAVDVVYAPLEPRLPWFPLTGAIMVPAARTMVKFEWYEDEWQSEAAAWALATAAGALRSGRLFKDGERIGFLPSAGLSTSRELIASLPAPPGEPEDFEVGAEGEDGALLAGMLREMDRR